MTQKIDRRDFLKLMGLGSLSWAAPQFLYRAAEQLQDIARPNVLIVVFDTLSAYHISMHGYSRQTMPNLVRLAEKAIVYHNHYANGNFTTTGTASLLTGTLPWTHRALNHNDTVAEPFVEQNIFGAFSHYHRMAYSHNLLVNTQLRQFLASIDHYTPQGNLFLDDDAFLHTVFKNDEDIATVSWNRIIKQKDDGISYSLLLPSVYNALKSGQVSDLEQDFPRGLPNVNQDSYFILEDGIDWLYDLTLTAPQPFLGYFHFLPPHFPYNTRIDFYNHFLNDGYQPVEKPESIFSTKRAKEADIDAWRTWYDEFILYVDAEFARIFERMQRAGLLENTWVVFTSDHGELFERGISGHLTPVLYEPVVRVPLLIFPPGQNVRVDVNTPTSSIDLLPTLAHVTGGEFPAWAEGNILPPFNPKPPNEPRDIYALQSKGTDKDEPILQATAMLVQGNYKLTRFWGYAESEEDIVELYNLKEDPQELNNLSIEEKAKANELLAVLNAKLDEVEQQRIETT